MNTDDKDFITDKIAGLLVHYSRYISYMYGVEVDGASDGTTDMVIGFLNDEHNKIDEFLDYIEIREHK